MNYLQLEREKKKEKEKRAYRESLSFSPQNKWILLFRVIGAYQTGWTRISRLFSRTESTYRDRGREENRTPSRMECVSVRFDSMRKQGSIRVDERVNERVHSFRNTTILSSKLYFPLKIIASTQDHPSPLLTRHRKSKTSNLRNLAWSSLFLKIISCNLVKISRHLLLSHESRFHSVARPIRLHVFYT